MGFVLFLMAVVFLIACLSSGGGRETFANYVGNSETGKFHRADCVQVKKMNPAHAVALSSRESAIDSGYIPCKICKP